MRTKSTIRKRCGTYDFRLAENEGYKPHLTVPGQTAYRVGFFYGSYLNHSDCEDTASKATLIFVNKAWHWDLGDVVSISISIPGFIFSLKFVI